MKGVNNLRTTNHGSIGQRVAASTQDDDLGEEIEMRFDTLSNLLSKGGTSKKGKRTKAGSSHRQDQQALGELGRTNHGKLLLGVNEKTQHTDVHHTTIIHKCVSSCTVRSCRPLHDIFLAAVQAVH